MAACFSILAWRIPWTEGPGGLQSIGSHSQTTTKATWHTQGNEAQRGVCLLLWQRTRKVTQTEPEQTVLLPRIPWNHC